jgi:Ca2+-binding EF-hand superfamily protein
MGKMKYGSIKKMTFPEFLYLINQAYKFLNVTISEESGRKLFDTMDTDRDNLITYEEYFKVLHINACKNEPLPEMKIEETPERHSKLRKYMWDRLRILFDAHLKGRSLLVN